MPITYEFESDGRLIVTRCVGDTVLTEVLQHFGQLVNDPNCPPVLDVLLDLTEMTTVPDSSQLHAAARAAAQATEHVQFDHCAIVASTEPVRGLAMAWQMFAQRSFRAAETFRTFEEARAWLATSRT
jgi:predicted N-formylglutamate amidohydrolase